MTVEQPEHSEIEPRYASGGIVHGPGTADDDRVPFPVSRCMFEDVARVVVLPRTCDIEGHHGCTPYDCRWAPPEPAGEDRTQ
ncbi:MULTISPECIES: hypothetical protein [unclassified Micromonospora]|uniref:hypothetical protein n=1 Tax=unclassified Micromonospora TaxID=2617518 RepID=UPI003327D692